jgi:PAS domain S-box-containing protein
MNQTGAPAHPLSDTATLLEAIVRSSDDAILSKNLDGIITSWNVAAARLFGYSEKEMVGASILRLIPEDLHSEEREIIAKLRAGQRIEHFETTRMRKDGTRFPVSLTISPIKDATGTVIGASKILRDISDRKQLERSLIQAEKLAATGRMAASIAHEINNPLEALLNLIFLAKHNAHDPAEARTYLSAAESEIARISHIAKQTLGYYREQSGPTCIPLSNLVRETLKFYEPKLNSADITVERNLDCETPLWIKRGEMMQILSNLVANASNAMADGGKLAVSLRQTVEPSARGSTAEGVLLEVEDTGCGIAPEHRDKIFEPFFTTRGDVGTGIGLWVTRQFVEGHRGTIRVASSIDPVSHGTRMSIFLPYENGLAPNEESLSPAPEHVAAGAD